LPAPDRVEDKTIQQLCRKCAKIVTAVLTIGWFGGLFVLDRSVCPCGNLLWEWTAGGGIKTQEFVTYAEKKEPPKGQLRLF
jgi:hypothetical protein